MCAAIKRWFSAVNKVIPRHSLSPSTTRFQIPPYQRRNANWRWRAIFNSMLIIATKTRSCSGRPIPGRNNHPSFAVRAMLLKKQLIYKMAISRKRLRYRRLKKLYIQIRTAALLGVLCLGNSALKLKAINFKYGKPRPVWQIAAVGLMQPTVPQKWRLEIPALKFTLSV